MAPVNGASCSDVCSNHAGGSTDSSTRAGGSSIQQATATFAADPSFSTTPSAVILMARKALFVACFAVCYALLSAVLPTWLTTWVVTVVLAAFLAHWTLAIMITRLPKTYINNIRCKAVLVTGCDSGFGLQLATRLHSMGATVFAGVLNEKSAGAQELKKLGDHGPRGGLTIIPLDVTRDEDVQKAFATVTAILGDKKLQAVVNNAGVSEVTEVEWCPVETYRRVLEVNALGPIRVTKAFLPLLRSKGSNGRVVIVASLAGRYTFPGFTAYSMSKSAAVSFADGLRREMRKWSITVHTVEPTLYRTPICGTDEVQGMMQRHWDRSSDTIKSTYGEEYFQEFKNKMLTQLKRAKPPSKICEVVDDMVDAVFGVEPKMRYVPSVVTQLRAQVITAMPTPMQDFLLCQAQPATPPAEVTRRRLRHNSLKQQQQQQKSHPTLQRLRSVPAWFMRSNSERVSPTTKFPFTEAPDLINLVPASNGAATKGDGSPTDVSREITKVEE